MRRGAGACPGLAAPSRRGVREAALYSNWDTTLGCCDPKMKTGSQFRPPASLLHFFLGRGSVRGTSPAVRTARAV